MLLEVRGLTTAYQGLVAISEIALDVGEGEIVAVAADPGVVAAYLGDRRRAA